MSILKHLLRHFEIGLWFWQINRFECPNLNVDVKRSVKLKKIRKSYIYKKVIVIEYCGIIIYYLSTI